MPSQYKEWNKLIEQTKVQLLLNWLQPLLFAQPLPQVHPHFSKHLCPPVTPLSPSSLAPSWSCLPVIFLFVSRSHSVPAVCALSLVHVCILSQGPAGAGSALCWALSLFQVTLKGLAPSSKDQGRKRFKDRPFPFLFSTAPASELQSTPPQPHLRASTHLCPKATGQNVSRATEHSKITFLFWYTIFPPFLKFWAQSKCRNLHSYKGPQ